MTPSSTTAVANLGEFGLISRIASGVSADERVITGIGDDAAVTVPSSGMQLLTSTDMLLEGVHFSRSWQAPFLLGRKSLAVSISDIAAMGGIPRWALLSLAIPADLDLEFLDEFTRGFLEMAAEYGVVLIGGDTCSSSSGLTISVTIMGEQYPDWILRRSGAVPNDDIWVTGTLGDAALGLKIVEGFDSAQPPNCGQPSGSAVTPSPSLNGVVGIDFLLSRLLDPTPRVSAGLTLAERGVVSSMIDISDGVLADFGHIAEQSGVGGRIYLEQLPLSASFRSHIVSFPVIPYHLALSGGEDYELCFTAGCSNREIITECMKKCGIAVTRIGIVTSFSGVAAYYPDGKQYCAQTKGYNHFN